MGKRIILVTALVLGLVTPITAAEPDPSLMGWWKLDGNTLDSSGRNRHGTLMGNAHFEVGLYDQGLSLDGAGDYFNVDGYKGVVGVNPFSIALWVKTTSNGTLVSWGTQAGGQRVDLRLNEGRLRVEHGNGNLQGRTPVTDGVWHHVAMTVSRDAPLSTPAVVFYVDGKDDTQTTSDADRFNIVGTADVSVGRRGTNNDRYFAGLVDEVRIYDKVLTADEVTVLALHPKAYAPTPTDGAQDVGHPLLSWKPREGAVWRNVYLGADRDLGPDRLVAPRVTATTYWHAPGLTPGVTYYWRVDEVDPDGTVHPGDVWSFLYLPLEAWQSRPTNGELYADPNATLTWRAGQNVLSHDVYLGTEEAAVAAGTSGAFKGTQMTTTFKAGLLTSETTYYWRIDEVAPDGTKVKGNVWRFKTLLPIAVADPNLVAWWSLNEGAGTRAIDWSGHGHNGDFVGTPRRVQGYDGDALEFGAVGQFVEVFGYEGVLGKHDRTVSAWIKTAGLGDIMAWGQQTNTQKWNFRVQGENGTVGALRVEAQGGRIVGSRDLRDNEWHYAAAVLQSAGAPTILDVKLYVDGIQEAISDSQVVNVDTAGGRNVRIGDGHQNRPFPGLIDDARIYDRALSPAELDLVMRIDLRRAWRPHPGTGSRVDIRAATPLTWTKGDHASRHEVYLGTEAAAIGAANASDGTGIYRSRISATSFTPAEDLQWGRKYFWRVDEINTDGTVTAGTVWAFTVADYLIVDDFESYNDQAGTEVYATWIDGVANGLTGSTVGYQTANQGTFGERTIINGGRQSMPMDYNNLKSPWYSEAERTFAPVENWTFGGADTLVVYFRGAPVDFVEAAGTITLSAAGADIGGTADEFRYAFKRLTGDGSILVRVDSVLNANASAKAGVMIRETLDPGSRHATVVVTPGSGVAFQRRLINNDVSVGTTQAGLTAPRWVKLTRTGSLLTAQHSADGVTWTDLTATGAATSDTVVMGGTMYIGLAVTSNAAGVSCTAVFSGVKTTGNVTGAWQQAEIGVDHPGNSPQGLYVGIEDSAGRVAFVTHPDPAATALGVWTEWTIPLSSFTGVNAAKVKKMYLGVGDRKNPVPDGAGRIYLDDIRVTKAAPASPNPAP